jgi:FMN phosphatase YigB (HAD superfamily)
VAKVGAVVFDAGETLFNEDRLWRDWSEWLGVAPADLLAALHEAIERRQHHLNAFERVRPGFDIERERAARRSAGYEERFEPSDLYTDALPTIKRLKDAGFSVGVVGNHPQGFAGCLAELELRIDFIASSSEWGTQKPEPLSSSV